MVRIFVKGGVWKNSEDEVLKAAVMKYGINNWSRVASLLVRKSAKQCKARWYEWLDPSVKKTEWTREEEEKLLHLAKLFPTQWRSIAPVVGRTAHQCLEHYEKLLDQAQGNDEDGEGSRKESLVPFSATRGRGVLQRGRLDDPRRLRPGEIDPHPETKPSRADAIDMQDDEKEMLQEARARLANTRGKKAKRKAREKQLEEARRLASLQKRRELKAAGLITALHTQRRRRDMDYGKEIPFEEKPPPGFHAVPSDEMPEGNLNFANISLQQLEGTMRSQEEMKLRREDARKLKRLQEEDLPKYLQQLEEKNKLEGMRKKQKLSLPEPALQEHELEQIISMGAEAAAVNAAAAGAGGPTSKLLAASTSGAPGATPSLAATFANTRTPRREDSILMEAANAYMTINQTTPLAGAENFQLHETSLSKAKAQLLNNSNTNRRTPHPFEGHLSAGGASSRGISSMVETTPNLLGDKLTPRIEGSSDANSVAESGGMGSKARLSLAQLQVRSSLSTLPEPENEVEPALPSAEELAALDESVLQQVELEEDMEDILKRRREAAAAAKAAQWLRESRAVQQHLPRPYILPSTEKAGALPSFYSASHQQQQLQQLLQQQMEELRQQRQDKFSAVINTSAEAAVAEAARGFKEAEKLINDEMMALLCNDAFKHPFKGSKPAMSAPELAKFEDEILQEAREMLQSEALLLQQQSEIEDLSLDNVVVAKAFENLQDAFIYLPSTKSFQLYHGLQREERLEALRKQFEDLRKHVEATAHRNRKTQRKYEILTKGYEMKAKQSRDRLEELFRECELQAANLAAFRSMRQQEKQAIERRKNEQQGALAQDRNKHLWMQVRRKYQLQTIEKMDTLV